MNFLFSNIYLSCDWWFWFMVLYDAAITSKNKWCNLPEYKGNNNKWSSSAIDVQCTTPLPKCSTYQHKFEAYSKYANYFAMPKCKCWLYWHPIPTSLPRTLFIVFLSFGVKETKEKMQISNLNPTVQKKEELGKCGQTEKEKEMVI